MKIILASKSPRRKELIAHLGIPFEIITAEASEEVEKLTPKKAVMEISKRKALAVAEIYSLKEEEIIMGADTVVALDNVILGKPKSRADAFETLSFLSGKTHEVYTGVTLVYLKEGKKCKKSFYEKTKVTFAPLTADEINRYLDINEYSDKAGSYAIQGVFSAHVTGIKGDYNNVVGLPVARIYNELKAL